MPDEILRIEHIGSTAIPGIQAKPVLDLAPVLRSLDSFDQRSAVLTELGYRARGEYGIPGRRYFTKTVDGVRTHQLHAYQSENPELERQLLFRDYLRAHPQVAREYEQLKLQLAERYRFDVHQYAEAKTPFVRAVERKARTWREGLS